MPEVGDRPPGIYRARISHHVPRRYHETVKVSKAVILAAGRGVRMKSLTEDCPKPMLRVHDKPLLAHLIERAEAAGITEIMIVTGYKAEVVESYFDSHRPARAKLAYRRQPTQDGTGTAALLGRDFVGQEPFLLTFGDILVDAISYEAVVGRLDGAEGVLALNEVDDPYRGAAVYVEGKRVTEIVEKPPRGTSTTRWNNAGVYGFRPSVFQELEKIPRSPRGEYELTDAIRRLLARGASLHWHSIGGVWRDVGASRGPGYGREVHLGKRISVLKPGGAPFLTT